MNAPRDLGPDFRSWLRAVPPAPPDLAGRALEQTRRTRQRRRWLWFLPGPKPTAGADDRDGHTGSLAPVTTKPIGGTMTMFTPTKLMAAAAVAALTGALIVSGPFTTQQSAQLEPGATTTYEPGVIAPVTGTMVVRQQIETGEAEMYPGGPAWIDEWWLTEYRVDDARLNGEAISRHNHNIGKVPLGYGGSRMITIRLDNDGGSWVGDGRAYGGPDGGIHYQIHMVGQGGYEGLDAILALDTRNPSVPFDVTGAIISGGLPDMPEPVPTE